MSSLYASRWADTPPAEETPQKATGSMLFTPSGAELSPPSEPDQKKVDASLLASRWADTPSPPVESAQMEDEGWVRSTNDDTTMSVKNISETTDDLGLRREGEDQDLISDPLNQPRLVEVNEKNAINDEQTEQVLPALSMDRAGKVESQPIEEMNPVPLSPTKLRLDAPRLKKKVSWRGKTCVISIPPLNYNGWGQAKPLSYEDIQQRLRLFEDAGFNTNGFDMPADEDDKDSAVHAKPIYPNESETRSSLGHGNLRVMLPDLDKWTAYMNQLTEQKLAALGVSAGLEEPVAPSPQDMSRHSSAQYPPLPFSPPLPGTSAASLGRPGLVRGHSHAMSVASPISPLNGHFGHAHRHSVYTGPFGFQQIQQQSQPTFNGNPLFSPQERHPSPHSMISGVRSMSPMSQFSIPGFNRVGSPAQLAAARGDLGTIRSTSSPLTQQMLVQGVQDYNRGLADDQPTRHNFYAPNIQQGPLPTALTPNVVNTQPTPILPQLPEEDDEEELLEKSEAEPEPEPKLEPEPEQAAKPEITTYVPPHKRAELNANIAVPTPRGHRHNISEGLEREILEAEKRQEIRDQDYIVVEEEGSGSSSDQKNVAAKAYITPEKDPLSQGYAVQEIVHSHKKTASRFNVQAPAFKYNPGASFQPTNAFTFGANTTTKVDMQPAFSHNRQQSSGAFNVAAPEFKPVGLPILPKSEFSFSANGPSFRPTAPSFGPPQRQSSTASAGGSGIFDKVDIPDFIKPARRSKAIAIRKPSESLSQSAESDSDPEDEEGRIAQSEDRLKRQRTFGLDGDEIPQFAEPTPMPVPAVEYILESQAKDFGLSAEEETGPGATDSGENPLIANPETAEDAFDHDFDRDHGEHEPEPAVQPHKHKPSSSLSALAIPFEPHTWAHKQESRSNHSAAAEENDFEEGELEEDRLSTTSASRIRDLSLSPVIEPEAVTPILPFGVDEYREPAAHSAEPSFAEIDAVMRQLNEAEADDDVQEPASISPLPSSGSHPMRGVAYLPNWTRSDAPSPSPKRREYQPEPPADSSFTIHERTDSGEHPMNGWPQVNRLNKAAEVPTSDWSADFSVQDDEKLHQRSNVMDSHIDNLIGRVLERRLQPLEESLQAIQSAVNKRPTSRDLARKRSSSLVESDADDEDEMSEVQRQRPISRGRDKRADQIKAAVLEALRESSPKRRSQLEDIRTIVEDAVGRQSEALVPIALDPSERQGSHRRDLSDLERRLNQSLAGMLEEADLRRAAEGREAESRRALQLAEEELRVLRDSVRGHDYRMNAAAQERDALLHRVEAAEEAQSDLEDQVRGLEKENAATYATLEEYRTSSTKWRQHIDQATGEREELDARLHDLKGTLQRSEDSADKLRQEVDMITSQRDELEGTVAGLERQLEESQESGSGMKRRLEKLHSDMATAAGQLASEKAIWNSKHDELRKQHESLEAQVVSHSQARSKMEEELREARASVEETSETRSILEQTQTSHASLEETIRRLQAELADQESVAKRFERDFNDARESGRSEVHRVRMSLETDLEAANHQVNIVRAELEGELSRVRSELENIKVEAETAKARHERVLEEEDGARREALRKVNQTNSAALDDARQKHDSSLKELRAAHERALGHAVEDKQRTEYFLNERLALSDAKLQHFQDRVLHLEERLEITKSAAQAAAMSAQSKGRSIDTAGNPALPDKISPQALRESILVLQEQLQERESQIDQLQNQLEDDAETKMKSRDDEIAWLRELLAVRSEELTNLVNTLARPTFDRNAVRDTAIRIRANLQMEQQEKERSGQNPQSVPGQAIASLSSFATPKAAQLTSAFNKWRSTMESSALKTVPQSSTRARSNTPAKASQPAPAATSAYMSGLMTPPASNLRSTPSPEAASLPPPRLRSRPTSKSSNVVPVTAAPKLKGRQPSVSSEGPMTPLFRSQSYDEDAADSKIHVHGLEEQFEDDDLDGMADSQPPAFRDLEAELEDMGEDYEATA